ncbi:MAG: hypothetical protein WA919_08645 [Coleofasciculaceae cyanobacterium]
MNNSLLLAQAAQSVINQIPEKPSPDSVVAALLTTEKTAKKNKQTYTYSQFLGSWRLCFITGTKKTRKRAGIVLGAGRYLLSWVKIYLSYSANEQTNFQPEQLFATGRVQNLVQLGGLQLSLSGPVKFLLRKNILAFDFTHLTIRFFGAKLYEGYIRNGKATEEIFYEESVKKQAFFAYFLANNQVIAARGRGGGLALWGKVE